MDLDDLAHNKLQKGRIPEGVLELRISWDRVSSCQLTWIAVASVESGEVGCLI